MSRKTKEEITKARIAAGVKISSQEGKNLIKDEVELSEDKNGKTIIMKNGKVIGSQG